MRPPTARAPRQCISHASSTNLVQGDLGDTIAILLILTIIFIGVCAFLGWYSRRRG